MISRINNINPSQELIDRFMKYVYPEPNTGCWLWGGAVVTKGYGCLGFRGEIYRTHRLSWILFRGKILEDYHICHYCDNPYCVNPDHLWQGTGYDNTLDMVKKKRHRSGRQSGEMNPNKKITKEDADFIRSSPKSSKELAKKYGVSIATIRMVRSNRHWTSNGPKIDRRRRSGPAGETSCVWRIKSNQIEKEK